MKNLYDFSGYLLESENPKWESGGIVLIKGKPDDSGKKFLYALRVEKVMNVSPDHFRALLGNDSLYRITKDGDSYIPKSIGFNPDYNKKFIGLSGRFISLNDKNKKTPMWRRTIVEKNIHKVCQEVFYDPNDWEDIKF
jgi:hypothetical protein